MQFTRIHANYIKGSLFYYEIHIYLNQFAFSLQIDKTVISVN